MKIAHYNDMMRYLTRPKDTLSKSEKAEIVKDFYKPKPEPMGIVPYIEKMNRLYGSEGGNADPDKDPRYIDPKEMDLIKKSLPVSEMVKKEERFNDKILKRDKYETPKKKIIKKTLIVEKPKPVKPPIIDYMELQDWLNEVDPNWIEERPDEKVLLQVPRRSLKGLASILNLHKKLV